MVLVARFLAALTLLATTAIIPSPAYAAEGTTGTTFTGIYVSIHGIRDYHGYVPSSYRPGTAVPLVVALHGCAQNDSSYDRLTRWTQLAEQHGFIVVYPDQSNLANLLGCWNWQLEKNRHRGGGEPAIIAGITRRVQNEYTVDSDRVFVTGASAGGIMANIMAVTYPDVYAAASILAGCEYQCDPDAVMTPQESGQAALAEMGSRARTVPVVLWQGTADTTVPPSTAYRIVGQWATVNGIDDVADTTESGQVPEGRSYTHTTYRDARNRSLIELYMIDGAGHAYPGGNSCSLFGDPTGPDADGLSWEFFMDNPKP